MTHEDLRRASTDLLREGASLVRSCSGESAGRLILRPRGSSGEQDSNLPMVYEERCVLIVDLVGWSKRSMEEQYALVESMNGALIVANDEMRAEQSSFRASRPLRSGQAWGMYKGTGDGAIFVFGNLLDPSSVREALVFAARSMAAFHRHNNALAPDGLNRLEARMALAHGKVYVTRGLDNSIDILGDAINLCARLISSRRATPGVILIEEAIYHNMMINAETYFRNEDGSSPSGGQLSDFVLGSPPDGNNFLYLQDDGIHETKDRILHAYNLSGRFAGTDIQRTR